MIILFIQPSVRLCRIIFLAVIIKLDYCFQEVINCPPCFHNLVCFSYTDSVTFRELVYMYITLNWCWKYHAQLNITHHPSVCLHSSFSLCSSPFSHPPRPSTPRYTVKVIAIYRVGLICQSTTDILSVVRTGEPVGGFSSVK